MSTRQRDALLRDANAVRGSVDFIQATYPKALDLLRSAYRSRAMTGEPIGRSGSSSPVEDQVVEQESIRAAVEAAAAAVKEASELLGEAADGLRFVARGRAQATPKTLHSTEMEQLYERQRRRRERGEE